MPDCKHIEMFFTMHTCIHMYVQSLFLSALLGLWSAKWLSMLCGFDLSSATVGKILFILQICICMHTNIKVYSSRALFQNKNSIYSSFIQADTIWSLLRLSFSKFPVVIPLPSIPTYCYIHIYIHTYLHIDFAIISLFSVLSTSSFVNSICCFQLFSLSLPGWVVCRILSLFVFHSFISCASHSPDFLNTYVCTNVCMHTYLHTSILCWE